MAEVGVPLLHPPVKVVVLVFAFRKHRETVASSFPFPSHIHFSISLCTAVCTTRYDSRNKESVIINNNNDDNNLVRNSIDGQGNKTHLQQSRQQQLADTTDCVNMTTTIITHLVPAAAAKTTAIAFIISIIVLCCARQDTPKPCRMAVCSTQCSSWMICCQIIRQKIRAGTGSRPVGRLLSFELNSDHLYSIPSLFPASSSEEDDGSNNNNDTNSNGNSCNWIKPLLCGGAPT